jgi:hypothetical protein
MPRLNQWSVSVQRELTSDLVVDVAYVGNRGKGFTANNLLNLNGITAERLQSFGLDINNANDQALLRARLDSPLAAARGFNKIPYASYSRANTVAQSLRPFPQFGNIAALGVPLGESRYDSLQVKATKRYSYGLNLTATFTWQNERTNMMPGNAFFNYDPAGSSSRAVGTAHLGAGVQLRSAGVHRQRHVRAPWAAGQSAASCAMRAACRFRCRPRRIRFRRCSSRTPHEPRRRGRSISWTSTATTSIRTAISCSTRGLGNPVPDRSASRCLLRRFPVSAASDEQLSFGRSFRLRTARGSRCVPSSSTR